MAPSSHKHPARSTKMDDDTEALRQIATRLVRAVDTLGRLPRAADIRPAGNGSFFDGSGSGFDVLIGRDILCQGVFNMSFDGHVTFSR